MGMVWAPVGSNSPEIPGVRSEWLESTRLAAFATDGELGQAPRRDSQQACGQGCKGEFSECRRINNSKYNSEALILIL
jgi:hypothetical protein